MNATLLCRKSFAVLVAVLVSSLAGATTVSTVDELTTALANQSDGDVIELAEGTYALTSEIKLTAGVTLTGAGRGKTILKRDSSVASMRVVSLKHADAILEKVTVRDGLLSTSGNAAGILVDKGVVRDCEVVNCGTKHWSSGYKTGGSVALSSADAKMYRTILHGNSDSSFFNYGGMAVRVAGGALMESCLVYDNKNTGTYAMYTVYVSDGTVRNCTIVDNATPATCAVYLAGDSSKIYDSIVCDNSGAFPAIGCTLGNGFDIAAASEALLGNAFNCVTENPVFVDADSRDYRLHAASACVDAGQYGDEATTATDVNGAVRQQGRAIDIGACEATPTEAVLMKASPLPAAVGVTVTFTLTSYGVDSPSYTVDFGDGESETTTGGTVTHVYKTHGSYTTSVTLGTLSYTLPEAVVIRPADLYVRQGATGTAPYDDSTKAAGYVEDALQYAGNGSTIWVEDGTGYKFKANSQIRIDKAIKVKGVSGDPTKVVISCRAASSHKMFYLANAGAELSGLTISGGYNSGSLTTLVGGDVYIDPPGGMVTNCILTGVTGCRWGDCGTVLGMRGGLVTHSKIVGNSASGAGESSKDFGAIVYMGAGTLANSILSGNTAGGGKSANMGGVIGMKDSSTVINCVIANNTLTGCAGICFYNAAPRVYNTILAGNKSSGTTGDYVGIYNSGASASYANCFVNCAADKFLNSTCQESTELGLADLANDDFHILSSSVCRDNGTTAGIAVEATDFEGNPRVDEKSGKIDIGAYEVTIKGLSASVSTSPAQTQGIVPLAFTFTASVEGGTATEYQWYVDGVRDTSEAGATYEKNFTEPGTHVVSLKVSDGTTVYDALNVVNVKGFPKTLYVVPPSTPGHEAVAPYDSWTKAATNVADALAASYDGCEILVGSGINIVTEALSVDKTVTIRGATENPADVVLRSKTMGLADPSRALGPLFKLNHAQTLLTGLTVEGGCVNQSGSGGNICIDSLGGTVSNVISRNTSRSVAWGGVGGGFYMRNGLVTHCIVSNCLASSWGTTVYSGGSGAVVKGGEIRETLFACNAHEGVGSSWLGSGGTVCIQGGKVVNCTVVNNQSLTCSGIRIDTAASLGAKTTGQAVNCIVSGNRFTYSNETENAWVTVATNRAATAWNGEASAFANCLFDAEELPNDTCLTESSDQTFRNPGKGDYRIRSASAARDAVKERADAPAVDLKGKPRLHGKAIDIGAYECQSGDGLMLIVR